MQQRGVRGSECGVCVKMDVLSVLIVVHILIIMTLLRNSPHVAKVCHDHCPHYSLTSARETKKGALC